MKVRLLIAGCLLFATFAATGAYAHLEPGSLSSPKAGQSYPAASRVDITWVQQEFHSGKYGLYYSLDGGAAWELIASWTGPSGDNVAVNYAWTLPDLPSTRAQVRVCQIGNCREEEYLLVSGTFTIESSAPVLRKSPGAGTVLTFRPDTRKLDIAFDLARRGRVVVQAFDVRGALVATLLDGEHAAGGHWYAFAPPWRAAGGALWFKLAVDGKVIFSSRSVGF